MKTVLASVVAVFLAGSVSAAEFKATDFGAAADGKTDCAGALQKTIDAAVKAGGGKVIIPAAADPYLVSTTLVVNGSNIEIEGAGATILLADQTVKTSRDHVLQIKGPKNGPSISNITVRGLTVDANYWNQIVEGVKLPQSRGLEVSYAVNVLLEKVLVRRAWVSLAFTSGARDCEARDCAVTQWHNDGFDAANGADNIRFTRCRAYGATSEQSGSRDGAWEIEDGAKNITLTDCTVEQAAGSGIKVRCHESSSDTPSVLRNIKFIRCRVLPPSGVSWGINTRDFATRIDGVSLEDCESPCLFQCVNGADNVAVSGGKFGVMEIVSPRRINIKNAAIGQLNIRAEEMTKDGKSFRPEIILDSMTLNEEPLILGDQSLVKIIGKPFKAGAEPSLRSENFWSEKRFKQRLAASNNVVFISRPGKSGRLQGTAGQEGFAVWKVKRGGPLEKCVIGASSYIPAGEGNTLIYSISTDGGTNWLEVARSSAPAKVDSWGGVRADVSGQVQGQGEFLLKVTFKQGQERLLRLQLETVPE